jgi:hypothetical protein
MVRRLVSGTGQFLFAAMLAATLSAQTSVRRVQVLGNKDAVEIEVESSSPIVPETRVLNGPPRLVIDFPNATPGTALRSQSVDRGQVKDLRFGLFQSRPPVTRIVVDLKAPQAFQLFPDGRNLIIKVGGSADSAASVNEVPQQRQAGLVQANFTTGAEPVRAPAPPKPLSVSFRNGLLSIRANKVALSQVLAAVEQRTGAEIVLAPGADQEKIVVDLGPAPAPEVISKLLYGSQFNFLILSAANDPSHLDRVILSSRANPATMPLQPMPVDDIAQDTPQDAASADQTPPQADAQFQQPGMPPQPHPEVPGPPPGADPGNNDPPE